MFWEVYLWGLYSVPLIYWSVLAPSHYLNFFLNTFVYFKKVYLFGYIRSWLQQIGIPCCILGTLELSSRDTQA